MRRQNTREPGKESEREKEEGNRCWGQKQPRGSERKREKRVITGSHCHGSRCRLETSDSASPQRRASRSSAVSSYPQLLNSLSEVAFRVADESLPCALNRERPCSRNQRSIASTKSTLEAADLGELSTVPFVETFSFRRNNFVIR